MERKTKYALPWIIYLGSLMGFGLAKFILRGIGVEFRMWVQALLWALAFLFPALLIGYYLTRIKYKVVAAVLTVIYAVLAVIVFLAGFVYLENTCLERFSRAVRDGNLGFIKTGGADAYDELSEEERWDPELYRSVLKELFWE